MAETVDIKRKIFGKNTFLNVVDVGFNQLIPADPKILEAKPTDTAKFFEDYNSLFYDIPASGSSTSHQELVSRSSEYLGINILDLEDEVRSLREENVSLKNQLYILSNQK